MSDAPLPVYRILEEEYAELHGQLPYTPVTGDFLPDQLRDAQLICEEIFSRASGAPAELMAKFELSQNAFGAQEPLEAPLAVDLTSLLDDSLLVDALRKLLEAPPDEHEEWRSFDLSEDDERLVNRILIERLFPGAIRCLADVRLDQLYRATHQNPRPQAALCLSGGGIRSATFGLGILQGLARRKLLGQFHYISTVSGGGYIGGWLAGWVHRDPRGATGVFERLEARPSSIVEPEPKPIEHLRAYSNYLTPRVGLASGDTWAVVGTYLRNMSLNQTILIPALAALLMLPRIMISTLDETFHTSTWYLWPALAMGILLAAWSIAYLGFNIPSNYAYVKGDFWRGYRSQAQFFGLNLLPLIAAACMLVAFWFYVSPKIPGNRPLFIAVVFAAVGGFAHLLGWLLYSSVTRRRRFAELVMVVLTGMLGGVLLRLFSTLLPRDNEYYTCFGPPLFLFSFLVGATLFVGAVSKFTSDEDREYWARSGGWTLLVIIAWAFAGTLVIFGPDWLIHMPQVLAPMGLGSAVATALLSRAAGTPRSGESAPKDWKAAVANIALACAAPIFIVVLCAAISLATSYLLTITRFGMREAPEDTPAITSTAGSTGTTPAPPGTPVATSPAGGTFAARAAASVGARVARHPGRFSTPKPPQRSALGRLIDQLRKEGPVKRKHHQSLDLIIWWKAVLFTILFFVTSMIFSNRIDVNKFSMHAMYRNRLMRAYLGASRGKRNPDPFTGFDPDDNVPLHQLVPEFIDESQITSLAAFIATFIDAGMQKETAAFIARFDIPYDRIPDSDDPAAYVVDYVRKRTAVELRDTPPPQPRAALFLALNYTLHDEELSRRVIASPARREALTRLLGRPAERSPSESPTTHNRLLFDTLFPLLQPCIRAHRPMHVVNATLNLVAGEELAWQERKAESFTFTPLHCGNHHLGFRRSNEYGGVHGLSLATAVAISGAAASPNMGYHSSSAVSFLMTLLNVRLGWWLGNPGIRGAARGGIHQRLFGDPFRDSSPENTLQAITSEALGLTDDKSPYVYLSDGGHFENLGLYEMVRRRCRYVVVCDAGQDKSFAFEDLGNAIRKIRIDFGIPIEIADHRIFPRKEKQSGKYCAIGTIGYSQVDFLDDARTRPSPDGTLIYIKPAFYGKEPIDVYNYAMSSDDFPHETTGDQFFSETQFESYRTLGFHIIHDIAKTMDAAQPTISDFAEAVGKYVGPEAATPAKGDRSERARRYLGRRLR
jgi:hypothetical protein